jgi:hypothetical protein
MPEDPEQFAEMLAAAVAETARDIPAVSHDVRDAASQTRRRWTRSRGRYSHCEITGAISTRGC